MGYGAVALPAGRAAARLAANGAAVEFVKDMYRHCKAILALGESAAILDKAGIPASLPGGGGDPGVIRANAGETSTLDAFIGAIAGHRVYQRETDPPVI